MLQNRWGRERRTVELLRPPFLDVDQIAAASRSPALCVGLPASAPAPGPCSPRQGRRSMASPAFGLGGVTWSPDLFHGPPFSVPYVLWHPGLQAPLGASYYTFYIVILEGSCRPVVSEKSPNLCISEDSDLNHLKFTG